MNETTQNLPVPIIRHPRKSPSPASREREGPSPQGWEGEGLIGFEDPQNGLDHPIGIG